VTDYRSRTIAVRAYASSPALLVLSEIYYPAGWKASIDGMATPIHRTNYILRSVMIPAGTHEVVFTFDPPMYRTGWILSNVSWVITLLCVLIGIWRIPGVKARLLRTGREHRG
jgi:uncharacterized membrane protein YfhO